MDKLALNVIFETSTLCLVKRLKFCHNCGTELRFQQAKFCPECGASLVSNETKGASVLQPALKEVPMSNPTHKEESVSHKFFESDLEEQTQAKINVYELGIKLEEVVEKIYQSRGYSTNRRQKIMGESGTQSEIDIVAKKGARVLAIECKNYASVVGIEKVRDFSEKLRDIGLSGNGVFVSLNGLSQGAEDFAQSRQIETMDSSELMEKWWAISVGRTESVKGQSLVLEYALPINVSFSQATAIKLANKNKVTISDAELIFHPYFLAEYNYKANFKDPTKELHKFSDRGVVYVDALDGKVLNQLPEKRLGILKAMKNLASASSKAENARNKKLLSELREKSPLPKYSLQIEENYHCNKLKPSISAKQALESATRFIIEKNTVEISYVPKNQRDEFIPNSNYVNFTPRRNDILIQKKDVVIIPRWSIEFESKNSSYRREVLACSGVILEDTMEYCPNHFKLGAIEFSKKPSVAVCESCGKALCEEHIRQCVICGKWLCNEHSFDCEVCHNHFCLEHEHLKCSTCNGSICCTCITNCPVCSSLYSPTHSLRCDICGRMICPNCITTTGLFRKNRICNSCAR
jgi:hypothetical protein